MFMSSFLHDNFTHLEFNLLQVVGLQIYKKMHSVSLEILKSYS